MEKKDTSVLSSLWLAFRVFLVVLFFYILIICLGYGIKHPRAKTIDYLNFIYGKIVFKV